MCQFCKGQEKENNITLCTGFLNKGSRNIFDNFNIEDLRTKSYLEFKKTDKYNNMMKIIEHIDICKSREKTRLLYMNKQ